MEEGGGVVVEEVAEVGGGEGAGEEEALPTVAVLALEPVELGAVLDALGESLQSERLAQLDEAVDQRTRLVRVGDGVDERTIDLQRVHGELAQVGQRRVAGAEVVDGEP